MNVCDFESGFGLRHRLGLQRQSDRSALHEEVATFHGWYCTCFAYNWSVRVKRAIQLSCLAALLGLAYAGYYALAPARTPQGQLALTSLDGAGFAAFEQMFDDATERVRIVGLFSPT